MRGAKAGLALSKQFTEANRNKGQNYTIFQCRCQRKRLSQPIFQDRPCRWSLGQNKRVGKDHGLIDYICGTRWKKKGLANVQSIQPPLNLHIDRRNDWRTFQVQTSLFSKTLAIDFSFRGRPLPNGKPPLPAFLLGKMPSNSRSDNGMICVSYHSKRGPGVSIRTENLVDSTLAVGGQLARFPCSSHGWHYGSGPVFSSEPLERTKLVKENAVRASPCRLFYGSGGFGETFLPFLPRKYLCMIIIWDLLLNSWYGAIPNEIANILISSGLRYVVSNAVSLVPNCCRGCANELGHSGPLFMCDKH